MSLFFLKKDNFIARTLHDRQSCCMNVARMMVALRNHFQRMDILQDHAGILQDFGVIMYNLGRALHDSYRIMQDSRWFWTIV